MNDPPHVLADHPMESGGSSTGGSAQRDLRASRPWFLQLPRPLTPWAETASRYSVFKFRKDVVAGLTVSVVEVPQSMAYALLAGVPPQYGIFTSIIQGIVGALFSSSQHLTTGPTNTQSLLIASAVSRLANPSADPATYIRLVIGLALMKGLIQLAFAAARTGAMVRYVSGSVIVGLASGAGILIVLSQIPHVLGIAGGGDAPRFAGALGQLEKVVRHAGDVNGQALIVGGISLMVVLAARVAPMRLPGALLGVVAGGGVVAAMGWSGRELALVGELPRAFPAIAVPHLSWAEVEGLFGGALALALLGMIESVAIAKGIGNAGRARINANQEFFTQGLANAASSLFQCIPGSGSFTRSALDHAAGAQTRFAAVFSALFVAILFYAAGAWAKFIPLASLGAVLLVIGWGLIDWGYVPRIYRASRSDAVVCGMTFAAAMVLPLEFAIFAGVFLNLALYVRTASRLHVSEMIHRPGHPFLERPIVDRRTGENQVIFLQLEGDLFFALADELQDRLNDLLGSGARVVILRLKRTHSIDATVLGVLDQFATDLRAHGGHAILCGVKPELMAVMSSYGLVDRIGTDNVFPTGGGIFTSAKLALNRAEQLVGHSIDMLGIDTDEREPPDYVI